MRRAPMMRTRKKKVKARVGRIRCCSKQRGCSRRPSGAFNGRRLSFLLVDLALESLTDARPSLSGHFEMGLMRAWLPVWREGSGLLKLIHLSDDLDEELSETRHRASFLPTFQACLRSNAFDLKLPPRVSQERVSRALRDTASWSAPRVTPWATQWPLYRRQPREPPLPQHFFFFDMQCSPHIRSSSKSKRHKKSRSRCSHTGHGQHHHHVL